MTIHVVCDTSGSMGDAGKALTMRTWVMAVAQWMQYGYGGTEVKLYGLNSEVHNFFDWNVKTEFPIELLSCFGSSNFEALIQVFGEKFTGKILLLSDGYFSQSDAKLFKKWKETLPLNTLRIIKIGVDANPQLKGSDVFAAEEFFAAMSGWLESGTA